MPHSGSAGTAGRSYRGADAGQRAAARRVRLIDAGIEVYGTTGYRTASIERLCAAAGLTKRYFYESFANSEELLLACYAAVSEKLLTSMVAAVAAAPSPLADRVRAAVDGFLAAIDADPRIARITLLEILGVGPAVDAAYRQATDTFARAVVGLAHDAFDGSGYDEYTRLVIGQGVIGAITTVARQWFLDGRATDRAAVAAGCYPLVLGPLSPDPDR